MDFRLPQVKFCIISFTNCPGKIKNTGFCFKSKPKTAAKISIIDVSVLAIIFPHPPSTNHRNKNSARPGNGIPMYQSQIVKDIGFLHQNLVIIYNPRSGKVHSENIAALKNAAIECRFIYVLCLPNGKYFAAVALIRNW